MSVSDTVEQVTRRLRRLDYVRSIMAAPIGGPSGRQIIDFNVVFPGGSMSPGKFEGRDASILRSSITITDGGVEMYALRFPPVPAEDWGNTELRRLMLDIVPERMGGLEPDININGDGEGAHSVEWTPHVEEQSVAPPYPDPMQVVDLLTEVFPAYEERVFDPSKAGFEAPGDGSALDVAKAAMPTVRRAGGEEISANGMGLDFAEIAFKLPSPPGAESPRKIPSQIAFNQDGMAEYTIRFPRIEAAEEAIAEVGREIIAAADPPGNPKLRTVELGIGRPKRKALHIYDTRTEDVSLQDIRPLIQAAGEAMGRDIFRKPHLEAPSDRFPASLARKADNVETEDMGDRPRYTFRLRTGTESPAIITDQAIPSNLSAGEDGTLSGTLRPPVVDANEMGKGALEDAIRSVTDVPMDVRVKFNSAGFSYRPHLVVDGIPAHKALGLVADLNENYVRAVTDAADGREPGDYGHGTAGRSDLDLDAPGFAAPPVAEEADLFHVTRGMDAEDIARDGLLRRAPTLADKRVQDAVPGDDPPRMVEESREQKTNRQFDELMGDARREVDSSLTSHRASEAVFAWAEESNALRIADQGRVVVAIDSRKLPAGCRPVKGPISVSDEIYQGLWEMNSPNRMFDMDEEERLYEVAKDYWRDVMPYEYGDDDSPFGRAEVWMPCDVPPDAIAAIYDPDTQRVIYEPVDAAQSTLRDFDRNRR